MIYTEYSVWLLVISTLLAAFLAWRAYKHLPLQTNGPNGIWFNSLAAVCRFLTLVTLCWLLIGLIFKNTNNQTQKPLLVMAVDNSASMLAGNAVNVLPTIEAINEQLKAKTAQKFEWVEASIGKKTQPNQKFDFAEKQSNLSDVFDWCNNQFPKQNIGAIIMATDGIYNVGENPLDAVTQKNMAPVYTIGFGDTTDNPDVSIAAVRHNQTVFKNNTYRIEVDIKTKNLPLTNAIIKVAQNGKVMFTKTVALNKFNTFVYELTANQLPVEQLVVEIASNVKEKNKQNNRWEGFVEVEDGAKNISIFGYAPHPDLGALKTVLSNNQRFKVQMHLVTQNANYSLTNNQLVVMHQLPGPNGEGVNIIKACKEANIPILYVVGSLTGLTYLNQLETGFKCTFRTNALNEAQPYYAPNFAAFNIQPDEQAAFNELPPLAAPFGTYVLKEENQVLLYQQLGFVKTDYPLVFLSGTTKKVGVIGGEGVWKWHLHEAKTGKFGITQTLVDGMAQFLVNTNPADKLRISHTPIFSEDDELILHGELFNETMQLTNLPELNMELTNARNKHFSYVFDKVDNQYKLQLHNLEAGQYRYKCKAVLGKNVYEKSGAFVVKKLFTELADTKANHQMLKQLATQTSGKFYLPNQAEALVDDLLKNDQIKPIVYTQTQFMQLIDWRWLLLVLMACLTAEWVIRKWFGIT